MDLSLDHASLKNRQRAERDTYPPNLALRVHRALSWFDRANQCVDDDDARFVFLWIAFNAAYANDLDAEQRRPEQVLFFDFLQKLEQLDVDNVLYELIWSEFPRSIRLLLDNRYVFQPFWDFHNKKLTESEWKQKFSGARAAANKALGGHQTTAVLAIVLARMYTLRNQLIHGGATWNSAVNRTQLRDCSAFLGKLVPFIIQLMMDNPNTLWGEACYPVISDGQGSSAQ